MHSKIILNMSCVFMRFSNFIKIFSIRSHVFGCEVNAFSPSPKKHIDKLEISFPISIDFLTEEDFSNICTTKDVLMPFLMEGHMLAVARIGGTCVHMTLVRTSGDVAAGGESRLFRLSYDELYIHGCYTNSQFRGMNIFPHVLEQVINHFKHAGLVQRIFISSRVENIPSIKGIRKAGFHYLFSVHTIRTFNGRLRRCMRYQDIPSE